MVSSKTAWLIVAISCASILSGCSSTAHCTNEIGTVFTEDVLDDELFLDEINPASIPTRAKLISHYYYHRMHPSSMEMLKVSKAMHLRHVMWIIKNAPDADILRTEAGSVFGHLNYDQEFFLLMAWVDAVERHWNNPVIIETAMECWVFKYPASETAAGFYEGWKDRIEELAESEIVEIN